MLGMIKTTTHNRIVAEKDAEIAGLMKRLSAAKQANQDASNIIALHEEQYSFLQSRLAPFTTLRARDDKGRFIKDTVA